jgi:hypothetical protein
MERKLRVGGLAWLAHNYRASTFIILMQDIRRI